MNSRQFSFFAFAAGKVSSESSDIKRYIGVAPVFVTAVNPSKQQLEEIYNTTIEKDPEYISEVEVGEDKHKVKSVRIDFVVKTDAEKCGGINILSKISFFIRQETRYNKEKTKIQVIDKYGRTCWVTIEQAENHEIPMYSNGPALIDSDYRPCFVGEEDLTNFIKNYLNIPNVMKYTNKVWVMSNTPSESEARLECINDYFKGDFTELEQVIKMQPCNKVKVMFGVKSSNDGKLYQATYTPLVLRNNVADYSRLEKDLSEKKANGAYPTTEFSTCPLKEYTVEATDFDKVETPDVFPFDDASSPWE